jgi:hypothetical protein
VALQAVLLRAGRGNIGSQPSCPYRLRIMNCMVHVHYRFTSDSVMINIRLYVGG